MPPKRVRKPATPTVADCCAVFDDIAPPGLAQSWDNTGLIVGDPLAPVRRILLCIDLTPGVTAEAIKHKADLVVAYHPPIFKPVSNITADAAGPEADVFRCVRNGIAIYSFHTTLDAAEGGTNDVLADIIGLSDVQPLEYVPEPGRKEVKLVTFVPPANLNAVAGACFAAGAGVIGDYTQCSYRLAGEGTFFGNDASNPAVGKAGRLETVQETRVEMVCPERSVPHVVAALRGAHPYEEPAFDLYPLQASPVVGIGRVGKLRRPATLGALARRMKKAVSAVGVQIVGDAEGTVDRAIIVVGAAGSLPFRLPPRKGDVIVTGEIRHHDALTILRREGSAIALGHWTSERPVLAVLAERLCGRLPAAATVHLSDADAEPLRQV